MPDAPQDKPDAPPAPPAPPPVFSPSPLHYRGPGPEPKSQWITDDDPRQGWFVALLVVAWPFAAACGFLGSLVWMARWLVGC